MDYKPVVIYPTLIFGKLKFAVPSSRAGIEHVYSEFIKEFPAITSNKYKKSEIRMAQFIEAHFTRSSSDNDKKGLGKRGYTYEPIDYCINTSQNCLYATALFALSLEKNGYNFSIYGQLGEEDIHPVITTDSYLYSFGYKFEKPRLRIVKNKSFRHSLALEKKANLSLFGKEDNTFGLSLVELALMYTKGILHKASKKNAIENVDIAMNHAPKELEDEVAKLYLRIENCFKLSSSCSVLSP